MNAFSYKTSTEQNYRTIIEGITLEVDLSLKAVTSSYNQFIERDAICYSVERAFDDILDLKAGERFILVDSEFQHSIIGAIRPIGKEICVDIIDVLNTVEPFNPRGTTEIYI